MPGPRRCELFRQQRVREYMCRGHGQRADHLDGKCRHVGRGWQNGHEELRFKRSGEMLGLLRRMQFAPATGITRKALDALQRTCDSKFFQSLVWSVSVSPHTPKWPVRQAGFRIVRVPVARTRTVKDRPHRRLNARLVGSLDGAQSPPTARRVLSAHPPIWIASSRRSAPRFLNAKRKVVRSARSTSPTRMAVRSCSLETTPTIRIWGRRSMTPPPRP